MEQQPNQEQEQSAEQSSPKSPGTLLKEAREAQGIELEELANLIKVPLNVLQAIEIDRIPKNLPETFIRGYIRSYAKKVGVEEALVLPELETTGVVESNETKEMQSFSRRTKRQALERRLKYATWIIITIILISLVIWWLQDKSQVEMAPVAVTETPIVKAVEEKKSEVDQVQNQDAEQAQSTADQQTPESEIDNNTQAEQPVQLTKAEKALIADNGEPDEDGFIKVEMKFENDCWVEVYDVLGERVAIGNKPAGYLMTLNVQGPINVVLGNPDGVSIWVNGKTFNTDSLARNRVARFDLEAF